MKSIVIVDDSKTVLAYGRTVLEGAGYKVYTAESVVHGLDYYRKCDAVLLDYNLRGLKGDAAVDHLKRAYPQLRIFLHTSEPEAVVQGIKKRLGPGTVVIRKSTPERLALQVKDLLG